MNFSFFSLILHTWKILNNMNPNSINLNFKEHARTKAIVAILKPLPKLQGKSLTTYEESFLIKSAKLWNILPPNLTKITFLYSFKIELNKFLSQIPDQPPFPTYPYQNDNSLLK